jgi:regulatory protein
MKIIQSPRSAKKCKSSIATAARAGNRTGRESEANERYLTQDSKADAALREEVPQKTVRSKKKVLAKSKTGYKDAQQSTLLNNHSSGSLNSETREEELEFDTKNLEAMPKHEVFDGPTKGKTRRRSALAAEKLCEPAFTVVTPEKKLFNTLFARGLRLLAMREHSVKEITDKLFSKSDTVSKVKSRQEPVGGDGVDQAFEAADQSEDESSISDSNDNATRAETSDTIFAVVDELLSKKFLCDERFTEVYIRSRKNRGFGPIKIRAELKSKGISNTLIYDHLNEGGACWFDNAQSQYQKKYGEAPISDYNGWTKRARFMQGRGFTMEHIHVTVPRVEFD